MAREPRPRLKDFGFQMSSSRGASLGPVLGLYVGTWLGLGHVGPLSWNRNQRLDNVEPVASVHLSRWAGMDNSPLTCRRRRPCPEVNPRRLHYHCAPRSSALAGVAQRQFPDLPAAAAASHGRYFELPGSSILCKKRSFGFACPAHCLRYLSQPLPKTSSLSVERGQHFLFMAILLRLP